MKYELKDVATVSGLPGLYKVLSPTRNGVVLESIDESKKRMMTQTRHKLSILKEISIFVTSSENSVSLESVFEKILNTVGKSIDIDTKTVSNENLFTFLKSIVDNYDSERVYPSDIKKIITWYNIIATHFEPVSSETEKEAEKEKKSAVKKETKTKSTQTKTNKPEKKLAPQKAKTTVKRTTKKES